jgi:N-acetylneuraminic acid mutarotase
VLAVDPQTGRIRVVGSLPAPVAHAPLVALGRRLFLVGGTDSSGSPLAQVLEIDPGSGNVSQVGTLPRPLADAAAVAAGSRIFVLGGAGSAPTNAVLAFRP